MAEPMTEEEMEAAWLACKPYAEARGISEEAFKIGSRIIEQISSPEDAQKVAEFVKRGEHFERRDR